LLDDKVNTIIHDEEIRILADEEASLGFWTGAAQRAIRNLLNWSWRRESNPRPSDYKSDALPAELRQLIMSLRTIIGR
jgi:hypothetical protein